MPSPDPPAGLPPTLVRVTDPEAAGACQALFAEYGRWSANQLRRSQGQEFGPEQLAAAHAGFRQEWPRLFGDRGRLYLAVIDGQPAGVGGLLPLSDTVAEIKRMYVRPAARRHGLGRRLLTRLLDDARQLGYRSARLETMTSMTEAQALYRSLGFVDCPPFAAQGGTLGLDLCELFLSRQL